MRAAASIPPRAPTWRVLAAALGGGLAAGALLDLLAFAVARWGPAGDGWSLRGNGALVVPFGLGPAVLAGGWAALARRAVPRTDWPRWGKGAGLAGVALAMASGAALWLPGGLGLAASTLLSLAGTGWMLLAPLAAALAPGPRGGPMSGAARGGHLAAALVLLLGLMAGFMGMGRLVAPGS